MRPRPRIKAAKKRRVRQKEQRRNKTRSVGVLLPKKR